MAKRFFIVACEASGDLHGAHLAEELRSLAPGSDFQGIGGPLMQDAGVLIHQDMTKISALGFGDVVRQYFKYRAIFEDTIRRIREWKPDAVIVIDSPAFNLRLAKRISKEFRIIYYISPQLWAWGMRRIKVVQEHVSKMIVILPFEQELYQKAGVDCSYVGHPLLDQIGTSAGRESLRSKLGLDSRTKAVALLAGSREKEVRRIFPIMLESAALLHRKMPELRFYYLRRPNVPAGFYDGLLGAHPELPLTAPDMNFHDLVHAVDFALVTSGTATLETALLGTPFFLLYKASWSTYFLGRRLIKVPFLGLVNLLAGKRVVPEFIQNDAKPETIAHEAEILLKNPDLYGEMKKEFLAIREKLGEKGSSRRAAEAVIDYLAKTGKRIPK